MAWNEPGKGGNGKDPWGKRRKQPSPPDLDELMRKFNQKLAGLFGKRSGSSGGPSKGASVIAGGLLAIVLFVIWVLSGIFIVSPPEQSVVLRFGKFVDVLNPGPHWIPRFIDAQYTVNVRRVATFPYKAQMLTKDENIVDVALAIQFRVANPRDFLFNVVNPVSSLKQATASALRQVIGLTTLDNILTVGREQVRASVKKQLVKTLSRYHTGIEIIDVAMQPAKAPEEVKAAFDDAIKAQEDEQRYINQAQAYAKGVVPIAEGRAARVLQEAGAYKQRTILRSKGDTARFLSVLPEYEKAPQVTRERLYLDTVEFVLGATSKILIDVNGSNNLLYLPLDRILQNSGLVPKTQALPPIDLNQSNRYVQQNSQTTSRTRQPRTPYRQGRY